MSQLKVVASGEPLITEAGQLLFVTDEVYNRAYLISLGKSKWSAAKELYESLLHARDFIPIGKRLKIEKLSQANSWEVVIVSTLYDILVVSGSILGLLIAWQNLIKLIAETKKAMADTQKSKVETIRLALELMEKTGRDMADLPPRGRIELLLKMSEQLKELGVCFDDTEIKYYLDMERKFVCPRLAELVL